MPIPAFDHRGLIPPFHDPQRPTGSPRSPYQTSMSDVVLRFANTPERRAILDGLLGYRQALTDAGLTAGFQWLDGSFTEDVEVSQNRAPNDIDVVTFAEIPDQQALLANHPELFNPGSKQRFRVDGYLVALNDPAESLVQQTAYWYSVWSHQRDTFDWKGFIQIALDDADDVLARENLAVESEVSA